MTKIKPSQFQQAAALVGGWRRPLLLTHARPDGDALGSMLAMRSILRGLGADPLTMLFDPAPAPYAFMTEGDPVGLFGGDVAESDLGKVDGVVIVDTCAFAQLAPLADWLRSAAAPIVAIDHHVTRDVPGEFHLIDTSAAAAALVVYDWAKAMGWTLGEVALRAIFVGIATDTGWFAFRNSDTRTFEATAELIGAGVDGHDLHVRLYQSDQAAKVRMLGEALATLDLLDDGRVAVMRLTRDAFVRHGAGTGDTEGIINEPMRIASVDVSVLLVESDDNLVRVSFRSKRDADVSAIAASFGGGGHVNAAGARIKGTLPEVHERVIKSILSA